MNSNKTVFLDTSIQVERILGGKQRQSDIEQQLATASHQFVTSNYVFMEFQRSVIADHVYVYNQVRQHDDWEEIVVQLRSGKRSHRPRSLVRVMQIFTRAMVISRMNRDIALNLLKVQIERDLTKRFWRNVEPVSDLITCDLTRKGTTRHPQGSFTTADSCRKATATCHLPQFLTQQISKLHAIAEYLRTHPRCIKDQVRVQRLLASIIENPHEALGQTACWPIGDMLIALQIPIDATLWTLDADLAAFTEALGVGLYQPIAWHGA